MSLSFFVSYRFVFVPFQLTSFQFRFGSVEFVFVSRFRCASFWRSFNHFRFGFVSVSFRFILFSFSSHVRFVSFFNIFCFVLFWFTFLLLFVSPRFGLNRWCSPTKLKSFCPKRPVWSRSCPRTGSARPARFRGCCRSRGTSETRCKHCCGPGRRRVYMLHVETRG